MVKEKEENKELIHENISLLHLFQETRSTLDRKDQQLEETKQKLSTLKTKFRPKNVNRKLDK